METFMRRFHVGLNWIILLGTLGAITFGVLSFINYRKVVNQTAVQSSLVMAKVPVDMLNDTPKQVKIKRDFLITYNSVGNRAPTKKQLAQVKSDLAKIKTAHASYAKRYQKMQMRYRVQSNLNKIFSLNRVALSPKKTQLLTNEIVSDLNSLYVANRKDDFVKQHVKIVKKLNHDIRLLNSVADQLKTIGTTKKQTFYLAANATTDKYEPIYKQLSKLNYQWSYISNFKSSQDALTEKLRNQTNIISHYQKYLDDLHAKDKAYSDWESERQARKNQYYQQKAEEKAEKQRREHEKAEEEKREKEAEKAAENDSDNDSTSSDNSSDDSSSSSSSSSDDSTKTSSVDDTSSTHSSSTYSSRSSASTPSRSTTQSSSAQSSKPASSSTKSSADSNDNESDIERDSEDDD